MLLIGQRIEEDRSISNKRIFQQNYLLNKDKKVLYIHTPYCPQKCKYCICKSTACKNSSVVEEYAKDALIKQIEEDCEFLEKAQFDEVYFGGGTPTYIPANLLKKIFDSIPNFKSIRKKCIEASPNTLSHEHLELFNTYEFDFLSVGIQSLQRDVCKWQNRYWINHKQLEQMSEILKKAGLYFNYDLIAYMGKGDFRDIPGFEEDLNYIMSVCKPTSINIHQMHQTCYTTEKMHMLYKVMKDAIKNNVDYECINSNLNEDDAYMDIVYQAQYRLVRQKREFFHYMWNKYPEIPVLGYDIYAIGYIDGIYPKSNVSTLVFRPGRNTLTSIKFNKLLYDDYHRIRGEKGLEIL